MCALRSWAIDKKGELTPGRAREKAHRDRVSAILAAEGFLYSVSWDGSVKMWDADSLELVMEAPHAHEGKKVHCAAVGPDGNLYTGGDDRVRRVSCLVPVLAAAHLERWDLLAASNAPQAWSASSSSLIGSCCGLSGNRIPLADVPYPGVQTYGWLACNNRLHAARLRGRWFCRRL